MTEEQRPAEEARPRSAVQSALAEQSLERARGTRVAGYVAVIVVNLIMLYLANHLLAWHTPYVTGGFVAVLWAIDLALGATVLANILFLVYDPRWLKRLVQIVLNGLGFLSTLVFYTIFPLDLGTPFWNQTVRFAFLFVMIAIGIATIVELVKLVLNQE